MTVENANFISELNPAWPVGNDSVTEGDEQIRTTKRATQQTFPNMDAQVTCTPTELNQFAGKGSALFTGEVRIYAGVAAPDGWLPCDGAAIDPQYTDLITLVGANTPNLMGQFIRGWSTNDDTDPDGPRSPLSSQAALPGTLQKFKVQNAIYAPPTEVTLPTDGSYSSATTVGGDLGNGTVNLSMQGPAAKNVRPANIAMLFIIKT